MTVQDLKKAICELPLQERLELLAWLAQYDDDDWDRQMAEDAAAGRLDFLSEELDRAIRDNDLRDLP